MAVMIEDLLLSGLTLSYPPAARSQLNAVVKLDRRNAS
jgi:hypothetical protein